MDGDIMGHYDEQYEAEYQREREAQLKRSAKAYAEVKDTLSNLSSFIHRRRDKDLTAAFENLKRTITAWRYNEGLLIDNPKILLDKLKK